MGVMSVRNAPHRVAEYLNRRFREVLVIVGCTCLAKVLQEPCVLLARFDIVFRGNFCKSAQIAKYCIRSGGTTFKNGCIRLTTFVMKIFQVRMNNSVHGANKYFAGLNSTIRNPAPPRTLLSSTVRTSRRPRDVSPQNRLMNWFPFPDGASIQSVVEE